MVRQTLFAVAGKQAYWIIGGVLCGLAGLSLDLACSAAMAGEAGTWGGTGAAAGAGSAPCYQLEYGCLIKFEL